MAHEALKEKVWLANMRLVEAGLVVLTWGNASGVDRKAGVMAIKPSGVDYETMHAEDMVIVSLSTGEVIKGDKRASSDTPTHLALYQAFPALGGIIHTHSSHGTSWAQACRAIPCFGTTHADTFHGDVPLTRPLTDAEIAEAYEHNTGLVIVEHFTRHGLNPEHVPGVLVAHHGPFAWGPDPLKAVENAIVLEEVARLATQTVTINPQAGPIPAALLNKHFERKHGPKAYYGQGQ